MEMIGKGLICAALLGVALSTAGGQEVSPEGNKVPARFVAALGKLGAFRLDARDKGWAPAKPCRSEGHKTGCALLAAGGL
jgi:hypothetical protein